MKGVILAGGSGSRLMPNTKVTNKHLLPVYNKPMIYYAIETLLRAGIRDILILPGKEQAGGFAQLLGSGSDFNANFTYRVQDSASGLAYAVGLAEPFVGQDCFMVVFGDNIILDDLTRDVAEFKAGAKVFLTKVPDPSRYGIAELAGEKVVRIIEKPTNPPSDWAVVGAYLYDGRAFEFIRGLTPSARGELEITDLNNKYIDSGAMQAGFLKEPWFDAGTHESLVEAAAAIRDMRRPVERIKTVNSPAPKVAAGVILANSRAYLPKFFETLRAQDYRNLELIAFDSNTETENEDLAFIKANFPEVTILRAAAPAGTSAAHNQIIQQAALQNAEFYLTLHPEMILEQNFVSELVNTALRDPQCAAVGGKLKQWHLFSERAYGGAGTTNFLESTGVLITREHRFINRGEGEIDHGQYDQDCAVFGVSGTAALYRISALKSIAFINESGRAEYFDELLIFKYKEDVDVAYRLQLAGYRALYNPRAVAYHDYTSIHHGRGMLATVRRRRQKTRRYKEWSFINHHIILSKYLGGLSGGVVRSTFLYELKALIYSILLEPYLLPQFLRLAKMSRQIAQRKLQLQRYAPNFTHIERWMV
ncbi:NTP transferase domain-containing protein [Candidatus Uhrbacteria bacterium]|nr:NTP transferase domain-containing protein [Candidatus Uhrbacteria bacterium]